ncbi:MAG: phosphopantetheine-binding protein [Candidatus Latescibacteria bacterium]|nr:phosphopantetheine-binding protein [Candidatus Latescibacterota bacterium]
MDEAERVIEKVKELVIRVLQVEVDPAEIAEDEPLFGDGLGADSMVALELVAAIEEEFAIDVTDAELRVELFESVAALADYVAGKVNITDGSYLW